MATKNTATAGKPTAGASEQSRTVLNQIVAIEKSVKLAAKNAQTEAYQKIGKNDTPLSGITRSYQPRKEGGLELPPEETLVQVRVEDVINKVAELTARLFNVTATKDIANQGATADLVVDGEVLVDAVPVTFLLTLEKELGDWRTMIASMPELDLAEDWTADADANAYKSKPHQTIRTSKQPRVITLAPATDRHPAQVQVLQEDVAEGTWTAVKFSGKIPGQRKAELLANVDKLITSTKMAREAANMINVVDSDAGTKILSYLTR